MKAHEINFDGIVGPTHNYAGLSFGNVASMSNKSSISSPRQAALEGLAKMKFCHDLGLKQAVLPPHERPHLPTLRARGYQGDDATILAKVAEEDPRLLAQVSSASAMWAANAATVSPSPDTADGKVHFTAANLGRNLHRSIETATTRSMLRKIFPDSLHFTHHFPLLPLFPDEGAANHTRLCRDYGEEGIEVFACVDPNALPTKYPARQTFEASQRIAAGHRVHELTYAMQNPTAIDAGAFHNDVVAVGNRTLLLYHELAWLHPQQIVEMLRNRLAELRVIEVKDRDVPLAEAISSYLFNSQLVTLPDGSDAIIAPIESRENPRVKAAIASLAEQGIATHYVDVRQSMRNGGGPACLRLRVVLTDAEFAAMHQDVLFSDTLHDSLHAWITRHYREHLEPRDLADPKLLEESRNALDELTTILGLGPIYEFQTQPKI